MGVDISEYWVNVNQRKMPDVKELTHYCRDMYHDTWFEDNEVFTRNYPYQLGIKLYYESGDTLIMNTGDISAQWLWYSYDTQNVYQGDPIAGAIWLGNLREITGFDYSLTDSFAEYLAYNGEPEEFRARKNKNLVMVLLNKSQDNSTSQQVKGLQELCQRSYACSTILNSVLYVKEVPSYKKVEVAINRIVNPVKDFEQNSLVLASRYAGVAEIDQSSINFNDAGRQFFKRKGGITVPRKVWVVDYNVLPYSRKPDKFLKSIQMLRQWCRLCK